MAGIPNGRGALKNREEIAHIAAGTMVSTDLDAARLFYQEFLGLECVRYAPGRLLLRDEASRLAMDAGSPDYILIDVEKVPEVTHPQNMLNHWGFTVKTVEEVDRLHGEAKALKEHYGFKKVQKITNIHSSYGFYFADRDMNWWEIECRVHGMTHNILFTKGDYDTQPTDGEIKLAENDRKESGQGTVVDAPRCSGRGIVGDSVLTHGTMEARDLSKSRKVYEEILGLRCVRHSPPAQLVAGQGEIAVVCIGIGGGIHEQGSENRWVVTRNDEKSVLAAREAALSTAAELGIAEIGEIEEKDGAVHFVLRDCDSNWWEVTNLPLDHYQSVFRRGDV